MWTCWRCGQPVLNQLNCEPCDLDTEQTLGDRHFEWRGRPLSIEEALELAAHNEIKVCPGRLDNLLKIDALLRRLDERPKSIYWRKKQYARDSVR